jgi:hypothetical protein
VQTSLRKLSTEDVSSKAPSSHYRVSQVDRHHPIHFGRTQAGLMNHPRKHHGLPLIATHRWQRARSFKSPSNRCQLERGSRPRTTTASKSTRNPSPTTPPGPSCRSPQREATAALSMPRSFGPARGFYVTASAQAECYHSTYLSSKSPG